MYHGARLVFGGGWGAGGRKSHSPPVGTIFASVSITFSRCSWKDSLMTRTTLVHVPDIFCWGVSGSEDRGGGDNSIQFISIGRVGDKSFKNGDKKWGVEGWVTTVF